MTIWYHVATAEHDAVVCTVASDRPRGGWRWRVLVSGGPHSAVGMEANIFAAASRAMHYAREAGMDREAVAKAVGVAVDRAVAVAPEAVTLSAHVYEPGRPDPWPLLCESCIRAHHGEPEPGELAEHEGRCERCGARL